MTCLDEMFRAEHKTRAPGCQCYANAVWASGLLAPKTALVEVQLSYRVSDLRVANCMEDPSAHIGEHDYVPSMMNRLRKISQNLLARDPQIFLRQQFRENFW
jgi:hypothetical protein